MFDLYRTLGEFAFCLHFDFDKRKRSCTTKSAIYTLLSGVNTASSFGSEDGTSKSSRNRFRRTGLKEELIG
ncbi:unnamed protein product [Caenorhabditis auriculariae]|uniref:Uncharacterized protein n=1 Tax=Caenorhabditis auriculariae TaxID=2777116 RepID=A0A8S1HHN4_9PELO|nr:unnamed protein product [Caenorhabditis auriculariae]